MAYIQQYLWDWPHDEPHFREKPNDWGCTCLCECPDCMNCWTVCVCDECPADSGIWGDDDF